MVIDNFKYSRSLLLVSLDGGWDLLPMEEFEPEALSIVWPLTYISVLISVMSDS